MANNRYNFASPGAAATDALLDFLTKRRAEEEALRQQKLLEDLQQQQNTRAEAQLKLEQAKQAQAQEQARKAFEALQYQREDDRLARQVDDDIPGDMIDPTTAELRKKHGFGGTIRETVLPKANLIVDANGIAPGVTPEQQEANEALTHGPSIYKARGGSRYLQAAAAAEARAEQARLARESREDIAEQNRRAAAERAHEANLTRQMIAGMTNGLKTQAADEKKKAAEDEVNRKKAEEIDSAYETLKVIDQLVARDQNGQVTGLTPGAAGLFGKSFGLRFIPGTEAADANATLNQLVGKSVVDLISDMKRQSRTGATGFGALSEKELTILQNAANKLNDRNQSDDSALTELLRIRQTLLDSIERNRTGGNAPSGAKRYNPATGKVE